jgi:hypothetical protein
MITSCRPTAMPPPRREHPVDQALDLLPDGGTGRSSLPVRPVRLRAPGLQLVSRPALCPFLGRIPAVRLLRHDPFRCPACGQGRLARAPEIQPHARPPPSPGSSTCNLLRPRAGCSSSPESRRWRLLRNRVDSPLRDEARHPAILARRRPDGTHGLPVAAKSTRRAPLERPRECKHLQPVAIENP